jgi:hypothetical protein
MFDEDQTQVGQSDVDSMIVGLVAMFCEGAIMTRKSWMFTGSSVPALLWGSALMVLSGFPPDARATPIVYQAVAWSGTQAPDAPAGTLFDTVFGAPALGASGQVVFTATLRNGTGDVTDTSDSGIWSGSAGNLNLVAREGSAAPGLPSGSLFSDFNPPTINTAGDIAFRGRLQFASPTVTAQTDEAIWLKSAAGTLAPVAREGAPAPGISTIPFGAASPGAAAFSDPILGKTGDVAFRATLRSPQQVVVNSGIWATAAGTTQNLVLEHDAVPDAAGKFFGETFNGPVMDGTGMTYFSNATVQGVWGGTPGSLSEVVGHLDPITGFPVDCGPSIFANGYCAGQGTPVDPVPLTAVRFSPSVNSAGEVAFLGLTPPGGGTAGIFAVGPDGIRLVASAIGIPPDMAAGTRWDGSPAGGSTFGIPMINASGKLLFNGWLDSFGDVTTENDGGVWSDGFGPLELIAREGDPVPGAPAEVLFDDFFVNLHINVHGQIAFTGQAGSGFQFDFGVFAQDRDGVLHTIAREGTTIEVAPGDFREIAQVRFGSGSSGNEDGRPSAFNDEGELAFYAAFRDGTSGVFVARFGADAPSAAPLPGTAGLLALGALALCGLRRRRWQAGR